MRCSSQPRSSDLATGNTASPRNRSPLALRIGDPLMRLRAGPGGIVDLSPRPGDVDGDGCVGYTDMLLVLGAYGSTIGETAYRVQADLTQDGFVDGDDLTEVMDNYGTSYGL